VKEFGEIMKSVEELMMQWQKLEALMLCNLIIEHSSFSLLYIMLCRICVKWS
jgi:hypothetical protein